MTFRLPEIDLLSRLEANSWILGSFFLRVVIVDFPIPNFSHSSEKPTPLATLSKTVYLDSVDKTTRLRFLSLASCESRVQNNWMMQYMYSTGGKI